MTDSIIGVIQAVGNVTSTTNNSYRWAVRMEDLWYSMFDKNEPKIEKLAKSFKKGDKAKIEYTTSKDGRFRNIASITHMDETEETSKTPLKRTVFQGFRLDYTDGDKEYAFINEETGEHITIMCD